MRLCRFFMCESMLVFSLNFVQFSLSSSSCRVRCCSSPEEAGCEVNWGISREVIRQLAEASFSAFQANREGEKRKEIGTLSLGSCQPSHSLSFWHGTYKLDQQLGAREDQTSLERKRERRERERSRAKHTLTKTN